MTKSFFKICSFVLCLCLLSGCSNKYTGLDKPLKDAEPQCETVSDGLLAAKQGKWIYYINGDNFTRHEGERFSEYAGALLRMKEDGTEKSIVIDKDVSLFNIRGEKIYLCIYENNQSVIASLNVDGTEYKELKRIDNIYYGGCYGFAGEYIYYTENFRLFRINVDGTNKVQITDFPIYNLRVGEKYAYFTREVDGEIENLYKIANGENSFVEITTSAAYVLQVEEDTAYYYILNNGTVYKYDAVNGTSEPVVFGGYTDYIFEEDNGFYGISSTIEREEETFDGIYIVPAGGGVKTKVSEHSGRCMAYYNGYIYYINATILNQLYRCNIDGTVDECVSEEFVFDFDTLDIIDNYLYFLSDSDYDRIYRLNMDTLETECIEYDDISYVG